MFRPFESIYLMSVQTIQTNLKVGSAAIFHKTIERNSRRRYLVATYWVSLQIWSSPHEKVSVKFRFCFNECLKCSVVI